MMVAFLVMSPMWWICHLCLLIFCRCPHAPLPQPPWPAPFDVTPLWVSVLSSHTTSSVRSSLSLQYQLDVTHLPFPTPIPVSFNQDPSPHLDTLLNYSSPLLIFDIYCLNFSSGCIAHMVVTISFIYIETSYTHSSCWPSSSSIRPNAFVPSSLFPRMQFPPSFLPLTSSPDLPSLSHHLLFFQISAQWWLSQKSRLPWVLQINFMYYLFHCTNICSLTFIWVAFGLGIFAPMNSKLK